MTTAVAPTTTRPRLSRWSVVLLVGVVDAIVGLVGVTQTSGAVLVASWVLLVAGVDVAVFALWRSRRPR